MSDVVRGSRHVLAVRAQTRFALSESGRLRHENSPDGSAAPRLWIGGSAGGNDVRLRADVHKEVVREIATLAAREPPLATYDSVPVHKHAYVRALTAERPVTDVSSGVVYVLPNGLAYDYDVPVISSSTDAGRELLGRFEAEGMPRELVELGFVDATHLWSPWCVALAGDAVASIAFTARLSTQGAEVGIATAPRFRGRGLGAAATAAWASLPMLASRMLFYSTHATNVASQRVAERLGLRLLGAEFAIT